MTGRYPGLDPVSTVFQIRSDEALSASLSAGYSETEAWKVADRARREARQGRVNDTLSFAGSVVAGSRPVLLRSYTGNQINPLMGGIANSSTLD